MAPKGRDIKEVEKVWRRAILPKVSTIGQAIRNLNNSGIKIVLIVDDAEKLIGTISDGDIRGQGMTLMIILINWLTITL